MTPDMNEIHAIRQPLQALYPAGAYRAVEGDRRTEGERERERERERPKGGGDCNSKKERWRKLRKQQNSKI